MPDRTRRSRLGNPLSALGRAIARIPWVMRTGPVVVVLERIIRRLTGGRHGVLDLAGLPSMELTVRGRKSGLPRTVSLLYVPDGPERYLLVGSNWGGRSIRPGRRISPRRPMPKSTVAVSGSRCASGN